MSIHQSRMARAVDILQGGKITENADGSFTVQAKTGRQPYEVQKLGQTQLGETWVCSCLDFQFRQISSCKHILAVRVFAERQKAKECMAA